MWPDWMNMLNGWQWLILGLVPPAIVALYFLKLKRRPVEVPSTYLWHRSIEDLHVNTIWQRLRRNLLLLLQLLLVLLAMLAVLRPGWDDAKLVGDRFIFLIDNSASMQATDLDRTRLEEAKRAATQVVAKMKPGDVGMVVSFADADATRIEQMFTESRRQLRRGIERIRPTQRSTSLTEAMQVASGLANPGRSADPNSTIDVQVAEPLPATLYIFSDGQFEDTGGSLGNLDPIYKPIGNDDAANVGVVMFNVRRNESKPEQMQAFAQVRNFGAAAAAVDLELWLDDELIDAEVFQIPAGETEGFQRDLGLIDAGVLKLRLTTGDDLALDDEAWAVINQARRAKVLLVTPGNEPLHYALSTDAARRLADVTEETPDVLLDPEGPYRQRAASGTYDLVIYDRCRPKEMPEANTLFIAAVPPIEIVGVAPSQDDESPPTKGLWKAGPQVSGPQIIDVDPAHPLTQWIDMGSVLIDRATPLEAPPGGSVLIESHLGPMFVVAPRGGYEDAVLGFALVEETVGAGGSLDTYRNTTWFNQASFPVFVLNVLNYLGGAQAVSAAATVRPGKPIVLRNAAPDTSLEIRTPRGDRVKLSQVKQGKASFTATNDLGVYQVFRNGQPAEQIAVNLFHPAESDIRPKAEIQVARVPVEGQSAGTEAARREFWKILLIVALGVLLLEWYIYHRRVYV